ncbi:hypothetical protein QFC19_004766 [Naganishia cerealis]|uniref:Uncharacterized protein n=1 Tax=Naganishia cerealis TaxID=610337 RepID=A0ACC2VUT8_9TREE|nr:hypothetical protein QFC19_004766 [Naganishia cerealis]
MALRNQQYRSIPDEDNVECKPSRNDKFEYHSAAVVQEYDTSRIGRPRNSPWNALQIIACVGLFVVAVASSTCAVFQYRQLVKLSELVSSTESSPNDLEACEIPVARTVNAPKSNIWRNLEVKEAVKLREWLFESKQGLNLTKTVEAVHGDNTIILLEAWRPEKAKALEYMDRNGTQPDKYARTIISSPSGIRDYLVGPLPLSNATILRRLTEIYTHPDIPYNARLFARQDMVEFGSFLKATLSTMEPLLKDLFGTSDLVMGGQAPMSYDGSWRRCWSPLRFNVPGIYLHPIDLQFYIDMTELDAEKWKVLKVYYNSQLFGSVEDFRRAWENGTLQRGLMPKLNDTDWATRTPKGNKRDLDHLAGPRQISFDGARFRVDQEQQYVTWMGWHFYTGFERCMGLNFWDINFRGSRIIYELTPQEALAQYSGLDPSQSSTVWLDRAFGMGALARSMIRGYDCPADAYYMSSTVHTALGSLTQPDAICIFERDSGKPLSRHFATEKDEMGATKGYELVVRSIATVGFYNSNYDYLFDYTFQLDGSIEIRFSASGYVQGGFWDGNPERQEWGQRIRETTMGALHDHVINYRVDFDIDGTANSVHRLNLEVVSQERPWFTDDDWGRIDSAQKVVTRQLMSEDDGKIDYGTNSGGMVYITNEASKNKWGVSKGYAVHPGASNIHLTNLESKRTHKNVEWAKHSLHVVRHKDEEPYSSNMFNINLPGRPPVDFSSFFDGESLDQEDLVLYLNLGTHHIIRSEDSPHTLTNMATSYLLLTPYNYNDYDVSMESQNSVVLNPSLLPGEPWVVTGHVEEKKCRAPPAKPFRYDGLMELHLEGEEGPVSMEMEMLRDGTGTLSFSQTGLNCSDFGVLWNE